MARTPDLLVAGAGPAGVAAAIAAARAGARVLLCDRARFPRDKTCGDGLTAAALHRLEALGVDAPALAGYRRVDEVVVVAPDGRRTELPLPPDGHHAAVVPRRELDAALLATARARGVEVREGAQVVHVAPADRGVRVRLVDTTVEVPWVVAADGHWSPVRRALEPRAAGHRGEWYAARQYFVGVRDPRLWVIFEPDLLPGYAWVFPLPGGRANVGFGVLRSDGRRGAELAALWPDLLSRPTLREVLGPSARPVGRVRAWPIPARLDPGRLTHGRVLFAGDAAGVVDPMTGEGIAQALESGELAGRAVAGGGSDAADRYRRDVVRALAADLRLSSALQRVLAHRRGARWSLRLAGATPWTRRHFARWLFEDYPRALVVTPRRWHRGMFTPPGAFAGRSTPPPGSTGAACAPPPSREEAEVPMASAQATIDIARAPDDVWRVVGEFGGIDSWMPGVESCRVEGDVRTLDLMGMTIRERLNERDDGARRLSYSIVEAPLGVASHVAVISVAPAGAGTRVTWDVDVEPASLLEVMVPAYEGALTALKSKLEG